MKFCFGKTQPIFPATGSKIIAAISFLFFSTGFFVKREYIYLTDLTNLLNVKYSNEKKQREHWIKTAGGVSISKKNLEKIQNGNKNSLTSEYLDKITKNSSFNLKDKLEQIYLYPIFVSKKLIKPQNKRIFFGGDALYTYPPSFAQGASQSIESSYDIFKSLEGDNINYYKFKYSSTTRVQYYSFNEAVLVRDSETCNMVYSRQAKHDSSLVTQSHSQLLSYDSKIYALN